MQGEIAVGNYRICVAHINLPAAAIDGVHQAPNPDTGVACSCRGNRDIDVVNGQILFNSKDCVTLMLCYVD